MAACLQWKEEEVQADDWWAQKQEALPFQAQVRQNCLGAVAADFAAEIRVLIPPEEREV